MDRLLEHYIPYRGGFFVEVGANDGYSQSNTYYFEKWLGWSGILIEGIPELYQACKQERTRSVVLNCALVPFGFPDKTVKMHYSNLMSLVGGARKGAHFDREWIELGCRDQDINTYEVDVPVKTLAGVLLENGIKSVDLLSVDVEGFELGVLQGLDFQSCRPKFILVEANFRDEIEKYLKECYVLVDEFEANNLLFKAIEPT